MRIAGPILIIPGLLAASIAAGVFARWTGIDRPGSALFALIVLVVGGSIVLFARRRQKPARIDPLHAEIRAIAARLERIEARIDRVETSSIEVVRRGLSPIAMEIGELGHLVRQMSEQIDLHEAVLQETLAAQHGFEPPSEAQAVEETGWTHEQVMQVASRPIAPAPQDVVDPPANRLPEPVVEPVPESAPPRALARNEVFRLGRALERGALQLHLEPIVTLPQRRVVHYGALAFMRDEADQLIAADTVADAAAQAGLGPAVDTLVVDRALRIARRLKERGRPIGLFVGIADTTLASNAFLTDISRRLDADADLAPHIVLEFGQRAFSSFGGLEREMLASLAERGFRFGLTGVEDLDMDAAGLNAAGVRHVRIAADVLTDPSAAVSSRIHPADLPGLFRRHGISLIADGVSSEPALADLLDLDVRAASGLLFGQPRPVRPEIFASADAIPAPPLPATVRPPALAPAPPRHGARAIARSA